MRILVPPHQAGGLNFELLFLRWSTQMCGGGSSPAGAWPGEAGQADVSLWSPLPYLLCVLK